MDSKLKRIFRLARFKKGWIALLLGLICVCVHCVLMLFYVEYSRQFYQFLYDYFNIKYYNNEERPHYLCTVYSGAMGNLIFQYAFSYMLATTKNLTLLIPNKQLSQLQQVFQIPTPVFDPTYLRVCQYKQFKNKVPVGFDKSILDNPDNTDIQYDGYFQSWVYWKKYEEELRRQITFQLEVISEAERLLRTALSKVGKHKGQVVLVGIHVRRGDMIVNSKERNYGYRVTDEKYLDNAMTYIRDRVKGDIVYVVCSNGMKWTKEAIKDPNAVFISGTKPEYDMAVLTLCDHFIMTVGTFGWWVGFLSRGIVIYYDTPFTPGSNLAENWATDFRETFFYPGWIGLSGASSGGTADMLPNTFFNLNIALYLAVIL